MDSDTQNHASSETEEEQTNTEDGSSGQSGQETEDTASFEGTIELSAESVLMMAQSIGVELPEDVAKSLGILAIERLRSITLLAMEFSEHENSPGLKVSDFRKAEELVRCPSYGHGCSAASEKMVPVTSAEVAVIQEGPEINLYKTISSGVSDIAVEPLDPTFFVHYANYDNDLTRNEDLLGSNNYSCLNSSLDLSSETIMPRGQDEGTKNNSGMQETDCVKDEADADTQPETVVENGIEDAGESETDDEGEEVESEVLKTIRHLNAEGYDFKEEEMPNEHEDEQNSENMTRNTPQANELSTLSPMEVAIEWQDYMKVFTNCFLSSSVDEEIAVEFEEYAERMKQKTDNARDFCALVTDMQQHGALPCLNVVCDLLCDYLRGQLLSVTPKGLRLAVAVIDAFICCPVKLNSLQMRKLSSVLIEIVVYPAPCEVLNYVTNVFMKCLKMNDDLLTWTCSYITEVLKQLTNNTYESLSADLKYVFCGAICLANGLESLSIQVAQEFGWHTSIISFLEVWSKDLQSKSLAVPEEDGFVEEEILKFCRNFLLKYHSLVSAEELKAIRDLLNEIYGEKLLVLLSPVDTLLSSKRKVPVSTKTPPVEESLSAAATTREKGSPVIRRGYWKNRKVTVTYRKRRHTQTTLGNNNNS